MIKKFKEVKTIESGNLPIAPNIFKIVKDDGTVEYYNTDFTNKNISDVHIGLYSKDIEGETFCIIDKYSKILKNGEHRTYFVIKYENTPKIGLCYLRDLQDCNMNKLSGGMYRHDNNYIKIDKNGRYHSPVINGTAITGGTTNNSMRYAVWKKIIYGLEQSKLYPPQYRMYPCSLEIYNYRVFLSMFEKIRRDPEYNLYGQIVNPEVDDRFWYQNGEYKEFHPKIMCTYVHKPIL